MPATLWCVNLVCADGNQIRTKPSCIKRNFTERLNCVGVTDYLAVLFLNGRENLAYGHYCSRFVVDAHNGNKNCIFINFTQNALGVIIPFSFGKILTNSNPSFSSFCADSIILLCSTEEIIILLHVFFSLRNAEKCGVVSLSSAACKENFFTLRTELYSNGLSCRFKFLSAFIPLRVEMRDCRNFRPLSCMLFSRFFRNSSSCAVVKIMFQINPHTFQLHINIHLTLYNIP